MSALSSLRVLVVDDDADQRFLLRSLFARSGIVDVTEAADAEAAVRAAATTEPPELIVLDLAMPGRSGVEVLPELTATAPEAQIVVVSGFPRQRLGEVVRRLGAVGYVEKGTPANVLVNEILVAAAIARRVEGHFGAEPTAPRRARAFVRDLLAADDEKLVATVELLVAEMVTNAVVHASSAPRVAVHLSAGTVRVEVHDDDPTPPAPRNPDARTIGGRGLLLVDQLASHWGSELVDGGKVVWFELDRAPRVSP